ncbi:hypothetical protein JHK86_035125 [Glycine max]|nr:hypothetical protein JHK86_035125 [Glycine max]
MSLTPSLMCLHLDDEWFTSLVQSLRFTKDPFSQVRASALEGLVGFYKCGRVERHHVLVGKTLVSRTQGTKVYVGNGVSEWLLLECERK